MYLKTLEEVQKRSQSLGADIPDSISELYERVTGIGKELYGKELLTHRLIYTAAVLHKACQAFKTPVLVQDNQTLGMTYETCKAPMLPVYSELYPPLTYTDTLESLLEKLAILTYLDDDSFSRYTANGVCPIDLLYQGQFAHCSKSQVTAKFNGFLEKYKELFNRVYEAELERIPTVYTAGRDFTKLADSLAAIEERTPTLLIHAIHKEIEGEAISRVLFAQIETNIKAKISAGISQTSEIMALQQASRGDLSSITVEVLRRLIFEANEQLQVTKLPKDYEEYKKHMRWGISAVDLKRMMHKDFKITAFLASKTEAKTLETSPVGYFFDEENPPKSASVQEQQYFNLALGKGEIPFDIQDKSVEELKAMGGEVVGEFDGEVSSQGLRVNNARQKKKEMGELLEKAGLFAPRE